LAADRQQLTRSGGFWQRLQTSRSAAVGQILAAFQNVLRAAMTTDVLDPPGVYVGTQGGQILASRDVGDHWALLWNWLPPVYALQAAVIDR